MAGIKKAAMLLVWRFQQINSMIIIIGLSLTLTFQVYPLIGWRFVDFLKIPAELDWLIILIIFIIIFAGAVIIGIIYDTILKLWVQQSVVVQERTPYAKEKITAKGMLNRQYFWIPMLKSIKLDNEVEFNLRWMERNMEEDPILQKDVNRVISWINQYKLKPEDKRWLKDLKKILDKSYAPGSDYLMKTKR